MTEITKVYVAGLKGSQAENSFEIMTNDMAEVLAYLDANQFAEFKTIFVKETT